MTRRRAVGWSLGLGLPLLAIVLLAVFWNWDWFIPLAESRASAALGRPVTIGHLRIGLGGTLRVSADDVTIGNPPGFQGEPLARIARLQVNVQAWPLIRHRQVVMPLIAVDQPRVHLVQLPDNKNNYTLKLAGGGGSDSSHSTKIGDLEIKQGEVVAQLARLKTDMKVLVHTEGTGESANILGTARGTYGGAPITGQMTGGALLSLRDTTRPWPMDLQVENGTTRASLKGTVKDPLHLSGADLQLSFAGQDMDNLQKLTGIPIPSTPPFQVTGHLVLAGGERVQFRDFQGRLGRSDIEGTIEANPGKQRLEVTADLSSHEVDLTDLGGFIGSTPGTGNTPGATAATKKKVEEAKAKPNLLPETPLNLPHMEWADVHLRYRGQHILGRSMPLDNLYAALDIVNGAVDLHPVSFGVGPGNIKADMVVTPEKDGQLHAKADLELHQVDVARLMAATHVFHGGGTINGTGRIEGTGRSVAALLSNSDGGVEFGMAGGDLSALLVDLSGLEFGDALMSALGLPQKTSVECLAADLPLQQGVIRMEPLILDTGEAIVRGSGTIDMGSEHLDLSLRTSPKHFTIAALPAPINVTGTFKKPTIRPGAELAVRGGLAAGLAAIFPPLALIPMIQFGTTDHHECDRILAELKEQPGGGPLPAPNATASSEANRK